MTEMTEEKKIKGNFPNLRFPEFTEEWRRYELRDVIQMFSGGTPSMQSPDYWNGNIPLISAISMHNTYVSSSTQYITDIGLEKGSKLLQKENLLLLVRGSMLWNRIPICYNLIDVAFNQDVKGIVVNDKSTSLFVLYWFQSKETFLKSLVTGTGIGAGKLDSETIFSLQIALPNKIEQSRVAKFLSLLDQRIETQSKIIEKYESLIKGITDSLFRNKKKNLKLKDCLTCHSSTLTESEALANEGKYPVYGASGIFAHFSQHHVNGDSILIIKDGSNVGKLQYASEKYSVIGTLNYLMAKNNVCLKYIYYYMQSLNFEKYKVGSGIPHIYFKDYGNETVYCPEFIEQEKIANSLSSIDQKILVEKNILENFYKQKKYLLQSLFI